MKRFCYFGLLMLMTQIACIGVNLDQELLDAIAKGDTQAVKLMLSLGATPNAKRHKDAYSALMVAAGNGKLEIVKLLVEAGADVNFVDNSLHSSAIDLASSFGNADVIDYLLEHGAELNPKHARKCLAYAAAANSLESVNVLLHAGAPVSEGSLHSAVRFNNVTMAHLLLENGVPVNEVYSVSGLTPLMYAVLMNRETDMLEMVKLLLKYGADDSICSQDSSFTGMTASGIAKKLGFVNIENEILHESLAR